MLLLLLQYMVTHAVFVYSFNFEILKVKIPLLFISVGYRYLCLKVFSSPLRWGKFSEIDFDQIVPCNQIKWTLTLYIDWMSVLNARCILFLMLDLSNSLISNSLWYWSNCLRLKLFINNVIHKILMCPNYGISNVNIVARGSNQSSSTGIHCVS